MTSNDKKTWNPNETNLKVIKRDGEIVNYDQGKIALAIYKACNEVGEEVTTYKVVARMHEILEPVYSNQDGEILVETINRTVVAALLMEGYEKTANAFKEYYEERSKLRSLRTQLMRTVGSIGVTTDRDNANVGNNFSSKLLRIASETNKQYNLAATMDKEMAKLHENLDLYYHDLDSYNLTSNCLHIATGEALRNTFNTGYGTINTPKRIESAAELSCILLQSTQNDLFGGQSHVDFDNDMAPFVKTTRAEVVEQQRKYLAVYRSKENVNEKLVEEIVRERTRQAMQAVAYNLNSMHSRAGSQVPFSTINLGLPEDKDAAMVCELFLEEYGKGMGKGEQMIFPNIIFRTKEGVNLNPEDPYYYLFLVACKVAARRMNPTFMSMDSKINKPYYERGIKPATMGCRTYVCSNVNGPDGPAKRGNNAPTTINLPRVAILAGRQCSKPEARVEAFFEILNLRLEQATESLLHRHGVMSKLKVKDLPFVVGEHMMLGSEGLTDEDTIEPILKHGTYGIGFTGLAETLVALIGTHHGQSEEAQELGKKIVTHIRNYTDKITQEYKLNFSCYATPAEGLSGKFVPVDRRKFGSIPGVTDKDYYTNGFHVPVGYEIGMMDKLRIEGEYHALCNAGHISYVEVDGYPTADVIKNIVQYAFKHTNQSYMGINFHAKYCMDCGQPLSEQHKECFVCNSKRMQGVSRVTGYLSLDQRFGPGKDAERKDRTSHDGSNKKTYGSLY